MAGRRPKPTALKRAQGNPGKRKLRIDEPTATTGTTAPRVLGRIGKNEWDRVMRAAKELGTITKLDRGELTIYCRHWEVFVEATEILGKDGIVIMTTDLELKQHPAVAIADKAASQMHRAAIELGFTPAARSKVYGKQKPKQTDFEKFQSQGGIKAAK